MSIHTTFGVHAHLLGSFANIGPSSSRRDDGPYLLYTLLVCSDKQDEWLDSSPYHGVVQLAAGWHSCNSGQKVSRTSLQSSCLTAERIFLLFQWSVFGYPLKTRNKSLEFELAE